MQLSPKAIARQLPLPFLESFSSSIRPTSAAKAPLRTFSSAYHGNSFRETIVCQCSRRENKCSERSGPSSKPLQNALTSCLAQMPENEVSVAPSATANRNTLSFLLIIRLRGRKASSYSDLVLPALGAQKPSTETRIDIFLA